MVKKDNSVLYGILAGFGLLLFYIVVVSFFQGIEFAFLNLRSLWFLIFPLAIGFGTQIGLYASIKHVAAIRAGAATSGTISGGSMVLCCSHYLFNIIPIIGITGLSGFTSFLMAYQKAFFSIGILSSIVGVVLMLNHKNKMREGDCH